MRSYATSPALERACAAIATVGCVWFAFTAMWGMAGIPAGGHLGSGAAGTALQGETMLKWHSVYPMWDWFSSTNPYPAQAICHHPFGIFWMSAIVIAIFGHHDFVVNLPAVLMSSATPIMLYKLGKLVWGPVEGAAAVLGFVILPLTVGYSIFHGLEVATIFGSILFYLGTARWQRWGRKRDLAMFVAGALVATSSDWAGYLAIAPVLAWAFMRAFVLPTWMTPAFRPSRYHKWWALSVASALFTLLLWVWLFKRADKIGEWLASAETRGGGEGIPLSVVLESRKAWIEFSFTPVAIAVGKIAALVAVVRFVVRRDDGELFPLAMLFAATIQYVAFKRGADVHIFWPHYFGAYYALALAALAASVREAGSFLAARLAQGVRRYAAPSALAVVAIPSLVMLPDTVRSLRVWRETGGRYDDHGQLIRSGADMLVVLKELVAGHLRRGDRVGAHSGAHLGWEHSWTVRTDFVDAQTPNPAYPFWIARASALGADRLKTIAKTHKLAIYGDPIVWPRGSAPGPVDAYSLGDHEPNVWQWMFTNNVEPVRHVPKTPDPWLTWEWRVHLDQPAIEPEGEPKTLDEIRIAHNVAVARGDTAGAERLRERVVAQLRREPETHFEDGTELMGVRVTRGVRPTLQVWFEAGGPTTGDTTFQIRSHIVRRARFSVIPANATDRDMAWPPPLSTKLWKKGFIYAIECALDHRIGLERYTGIWLGGPSRKGGGGPIDLVEVE